MTYNFGQFEISSLVERIFYLDGGTMFGIIPRKIWSRLLPVDENNMIPMSCTLYLLRANGKLYLVDSGLGDTLSEMEQKIYATDNNSLLEKELARLSVTADDIDGVLLTHLHTDHCGGSVVRRDGKLVPRFPRATYYVQRVELETALSPDERSKAAYSYERTNALQESGQVSALDGDCEIAPGIVACLTGGHTAGHQGFEFTSEGETVVTYCEMIPTSGHVKVPYIASTDLYPLETMKFKRPLVRRLIEDKIPLALAHDHALSLVTLSEKDRKTVVTPLQTESTTLS